MDEYLGCTHGLMDWNNYAVSATAPCTSLAVCGFSAAVTFINANPDYLSAHAGCPSTLTCE
jgi:hypothetical protein